MNAFFLVYFLPLIASLILASPLRFSENFITRLTICSISVPALVTILLFFSPFPTEILIAKISLSGHAFPILAWIDYNTFAMLGLTHVLGLLVAKFSHGYLHLEKGYQRYFSTVLFFLFGMELLSLAGNMDLFFAGWEIVGFSSFLLIAFYRSHSRSVNNAWRIYNLYRICDLGILIGAVLGHVLWHEATRFGSLGTIPTEAFASTHQTSLTILYMCIVFASLGKSAQFPFYNWPARAMEGPTPSSAIFYGALSIHAGVFLLLRTQPLWSHNLFVTISIGLIGFTTLCLSSIQGRIQTNIKGQIAYASTAQIGIMFIELSFGLSKVVLVHLVCHALYRCFQLLVSPSVVASSTSLSNKTIFLRIQNRKNWLDNLPTRWRDTLYVLGASEFFMDISWRGFGFLPWQLFLRKLKVIVSHFLIPILMLVLPLISLFFNYYQSALMFAIGSLFFSLRSIWVHHNPFLAMRDLALGLIGCMISVYLLGPHDLVLIEAYMLPVTPFLIAALVISWLFRKFDLRVYHALGSAHTHKANVFMICFMVLAGMPISTAFIGEDMLLENLLHHSPLITGLITLCLLINGLLCVKIYSRLFMGRPTLNAPFS